jgi:GntR family transcriptional regulator
MLLQLTITPNSSTPIYQQIEDQVRRAMATGNLRAGDQLPSVRALAEELVVNVNTVVRAYADLTRDGVLETQAGRGVYVAAKRPILHDTERERRLSEATESYINTALALDFTKPEVKQRLDHDWPRSASARDKS